MGAHAVKDRDRKSAGAGEPRPHLVRRISGTVLGLLVLGAVVLAAAVTVVPQLTGATTMTVLSGSMEPTLPVGSVVVVRPRPAQDVVAGDVITFVDRETGSSSTKIVTHRVLTVEDTGPELRFRTKGDANEDPDQGVVAAADVQGVLWYDVPWVGSARERLGSPVALLFGAGALLMLVAGHLLLPRHARPRRERLGG